MAVAAVVGVLTTQGMMAREAILPLVFKNIRFEKVLAHTQMVDQVATVLGPLVAALLLALGQWQFVLVVVALLFFSEDVSLHVWLFKLRPGWRKLTSDSLNITKSLKQAGLNILQLPSLLAVIWLAFAVNLIVGVLLATSVRRCVYLALYCLHCFILNSAWSDKFCGTVRWGPNHCTG